MLLAASCIGPQELPAPAAAAHYDQVREDVIAAVGAEDLELTMHEEPFVTTEEGECVFDPGSWEAGEELFTGDETSWRPLLDPLNGVLAQHGFEQAREFDYTNGQAFGISVADDHGLRLRVYVLEGSTKVSMHGAEIDDADGCSAEALGL